MYRTSWTLNAGKITHRHPSILWDMQPGGDDPGEGSLHAAEARATQAVFGAAERYRDELLMERRRQADVRERYGLASLDGLILHMANTMERAGDPDGVARAAEQKAQYERISSGPACPDIARAGAEHVGAAPGVLGTGWCPAPPSRPTPRHACIGHQGGDGV